MKKMLILKNIFLFGFLLFFFSCKKEITPKASFNLQSTDGIFLGDTLQIDADGGLKKINVKSNGFWKITKSVDDNWINIFPDFGEKDGSFSISLDSNNTSSERKGKLNFYVNGNAFVTLIVAQKGKADTARTPDLSAPASFDPILDISFKADGSAEDISPKKHQINTLEGFGMTTVYSSAFGKYMARFNHIPGGPSMTNGFYKFDYSNESDFKNALTSGYSMETEFMLNVDHPLPDEEMKMFTSHQSGGTGLMVGKSDVGNSIIFLPHVGGKYIWVNSGVVPETRKYYHVVAVWNKQEGKAYLYVNGELKSTEDASGNFDFPSAGSNWFGIGADPSGDKANAGWKGDVVLARVYGKALNQNQVNELWDQVKNIKPSENERKLSDIFLNSKKVLKKSDYRIYSKGFVSGDKIEMQSVDNPATVFTMDGIVSDDALIFELPEGLTSGEYRFYVLRGGEKIDIGLATLTVVSSLPANPQIIAHMGYWRSGTAKNSVAALAASQSIGAYGSEFDVHITKDGVVVVNHDDQINGITIEDANYDQIKDITLSNGEKLPTFAQFLHQGKKNTNMKLICEIKEHKGSTNGVSNNIRAANKVVQMVQDSGMTASVEYISFSMEACEKVHELLPDISVAYLNGNVTPQQLHEKGLDMDYKISVLDQHPEWVEQAQNLGIKVNVWTVDSESDQRAMMDLGVDFITTNYPVQLQYILY